MFSGYGFPTVEQKPKRNNNLINKKLVKSNCSNVTFNLQIYNYIRPLTVLKIMTYVAFNTQTYISGLSNCIYKNCEKYAEYNCQTA